MVRFDLVLEGTAETLAMTLAAGTVSFLLGLPLALLLVATGHHGLWPRPIVNRVVAILINGFRSVPFIILLVALIPLTRLIVGTSLGTVAAIVPLSVAAIPYFARIAEVALRDVDPGLIEAGRAIGATRLAIIRYVLLPEALPSLLSGFTVTLVTLIGASAIAGAVGAGGLGDIAIRYGYQRFETDVMVLIVAVLIGLVCAIQAAGDALVRAVDHRA